MPIARPQPFFLAVAVLIALTVPGIEARADSHIDEILGASGGLTPEQIFAAMDEDGDGRVTAEELRTHKMGVFFRLDRNRDGVLSRAEVEGLSDAEFDAIDQDGDGSISGFEFNQSKLTAIETMDLSGDGSVTLEEFMTYRREAAK